MKSNFIYTLHGFLGESSDWDQVFVNWNSQDIIVSPSYFLENQFSDLKLEGFYKDIQQKMTTYKNLKKVFIGYSLGARIGLRILESYPDLFDQYILISAHPGLDSDQAKDLRVLSDLKWIEKIQNNQWSDFLVDWNGQDIFSSQPIINRLETSYDKRRLVQALSEYSLGYQKNYSDLIYKYQQKINWIVGDKDEKFLNLAISLKQKKILLECKRIFSGHRILFENPVELKITLKDLVSQIQSNHGDL